MTRADKLVVKALLCVILMSGAIACLTSCDKVELSEYSDYSENADVTITFSPYEMEAMTRAATSISGVVSKLDVWISEGETLVEEVHQTSTDDGFGTVSVALNRLKTYSIVAVGHKASGAATLTDDIIAFPDEKVTHAMIYMASFCPGTTASLNCVMTRIVGMLRFEIADIVPDAARNMKFELGESFTRWNVSSSIGTNAIERTSTFNNFSRDANGANFSIYVIPTNLTDTDHMDITITALYENGDKYESKTFDNVPIKAGYKTTYHGQFFTTKATTGTFTVEENMNTFDTITY